MSDFDHEQGVKLIDRLLCCDRRSVQGWVYVMREPSGRIKIGSAEHPGELHRRMGAAQAWAAGALPMILQAILGLCPQAPSRELLIIRPQLPYWLESVQVRGLRVGRGTVALLFQRRGAQTVVEVLEATDGVRVVLRNRWPL